MRRQGFSRLNVMHLFRACASIARPDGRSRTPLHELDTAEVESAWEQTTKATRAALALVRSELGLMNMDILWSGALLVPLIALCAYSDPRNRDCRGMIGWLALAALKHRYGHSTDTAVEQDLRACRGDDPIGELLSNVRKQAGTLRAMPEDFDGALVDRGGLMGVYISCHQKGIKDLFSGGSIILQPAVERHHILPRAQFADGQRMDADRVANIAFVSTGVNRAVSSTGPEVYLKRSKKEVLDSQCIPTSSQLWSVDCAESFWDARKDLLAAAFNDFVKQRLPNRRI